VFSLVADLLDLLLPTSCAGCARDGPTLCEACARQLAPSLCQALLAAADAPECWAGGAYGGPLREVILEYKERRRHELAGPLGELLAEVVRAAVSAAVVKPAAAGGRDWAAAGALGGSGAVGWDAVCLVPVPSASSAVRSRGGDHVRRLAARASHRLRSSGVPSRVEPVLAVRGRRVDSVGLSAAARRANVAGTIAVRRRIRGPGAGSGALVVLVDDLVTTGATLAEAARVLSIAGSPPLAAAVLAATPRKGG
jgi:predicted amidophosphoribosyltransferase